MVTVQVNDVPELAQAPPQPPKVDGDVALAVSVTGVLSSKSDVQVVLQLAIPVGWLVTVPLPVPLLVTVKVFLPGRLKLAVIIWPVLMVTAQDPVPEQPPPFQPPKLEPVSAVAVSVIVVFSSKSKKQMEPQSMPAGKLVILPLPVLFTINVFLPGRLKIAVTVWAALIVTTQVFDVSGQFSRLQPVKVESGPVVAVNVTGVL